MFHQEQLNIKVDYQDGAFPPKRGSTEAAGYDLYAQKEISVPPGKVAHIQSGVSMAIPRGFYGKIESRSGFARQGIVAVGGVIDSDYRGPIGILLLNTTSREFLIQAGDRCAQIIFHRHAIADFDTSYDVAGSRTERGSGAFGSTGVNDIVMEDKKPILFLEGTSGVGKTTLCTYTMDYADDVEKYPPFLNKGTDGFINIMYSHYQLVEHFPQLNEGSVVDRHPISQLLYTLLGQLDGFTSPVQKFADVWATYMRTNRSTVQMAIRNCFSLCEDHLRGQDWKLVIICPTIKFIPIVHKGIVKRGSPLDSHLPPDYIHNQNLAFTTFYELIKEMPEICDNVKFYCLHNYMNKDIINDLY